MTVERVTGDARIRKEASSLVDDDPFISNIEYRWLSLSSSDSIRGRRGEENKDGGCRDTGKRVSGVSWRMAGGGELGDGS